MPILHTEALWNPSKLDKAQTFVQMQGMAVGCYYGIELNIIFINFDLSVLSTNNTVFKGPFPERPDFNAAMFVKNGIGIFVRQNHSFASRLEFGEFRQSFDFSVIGVGSFIDGIRHLNG